MSPTSNELASTTECGSNQEADRETRCGALRGSPSDSKKRCLHGSAGLGLERPFRIMGGAGKSWDVITIRYNRPTRFPYSDQMAREERPKRRVMRKRYRKLIRLLNANPRELGSRNPGSRTNTASRWTLRSFVYRIGNEFAGIGGSVTTTTDVDMC